MSDEEKHPAEKPSGRLQDPNPERFRYLADILYRIQERKLTVADLKGISRKKIFQLAEAAYNKFQHGRYQEAMDIFLLLARMDHRNYYHHAALGSVYQKLKRWVDAVANYSIALKLNDKDVASHVNRGEIYLRHEKFKKAAEDFRSAILSDKMGRDLWANRARSLVIALRRSLELKKSNP
jgi:Flp pilus assembly protein TadD